MTRRDVDVRQHTRAWPSIDERTDAYLLAIISAAESEGLDAQAARRIAFAFLKAYRPKNYATLEKTGVIAVLTGKNP